MTGRWAEPVPVELGRSPSSLGPWTLTGPAPAADDQSVAVVQRIQTLTRGQCLALLSSVEIGRVVFTDQALPAILPVTFVVDGDAVVFRTSTGSRLARAADRAVLAFEADDVRPATHSGWSVVVTGQAEVESDPSQQARLDARLHAWVPGFKDVFVRIPLTVVTGRQVDGAGSGERQAFMGPLATLA